jgi:hypothetical protein
MRVNNTKQKEFIKGLLTEVEKQDFEKWLKIYSPGVNTQTEFELIRQLYAKVLTHLFNNDEEAFKDATLAEASLFMVCQMYNENQHIQYHMSIINNLIQHKLVNEEAFKEFEIEQAPTILKYSIKEDTYEHHYKGLTSVYSIKSEMLKKDQLMSNKIYNIKVRSLDDITVEQLAEYKVWSQKAVDYLKYLYKLQEKLTIEQY